MAQTDQSIAAFLAAFVAQVAYIVMMVALAFFPLTLVGATEVFTVVMAIGMILHMRMLVDMHRAELLSTDPPF